MRTPPLILLLFALFHAVSSFAAPIVYGVDQDFGTSGSVRGTITTDGHSGTLLAADFLDFDLTLTVLTRSLTITGPVSSTDFDLFGNGVTATETTLTFDFGGNSNLDFYVSTPSLQASYSLTGSADPRYAASAVYISSIGTLYDRGDPSPRVFASVAPAVSLSEPPAAALFGLGALGIALLSSGVKRRWRSIVGPASSAARSVPSIRRERRRAPGLAQPIPVG